MLWDARAKSVIEVFLYKCVTRLCSQTAASSSESTDCIYCASKLCHIWKLLYSPIFLVPQFTRKWCFCSLWLVGWKQCFMRTGFMQYSSFVHKLNVSIWMDSYWPQCDVPDWPGPGWPSGRGLVCSATWSSAAVSGREDGDGGEHGLHPHGRRMRWRWQEPPPLSWFWSAPAARGSGRRNLSGNPKEPPADLHFKANSRTVRYGLEQS